MLRTIRARLAVNLTLLIAGLILAMLALAFWLGRDLLGELRPSLQRSFAETQTLNEKNVLLNSTGYLGSHLAPHLAAADIAALDAEIERVRSWLPIQSFVVANQEKRILTDGRSESPRRGQVLRLAREPLPGQPILERHDAWSQLSFVIDGDDQVLGYAVVGLSSAALQTSLRMLDEQVTAEWEHAVRSLVLGAGFAFVIIGCVAVILIWRLSQSLSEPISEMVAAAESCAAGNLDIALAVRSDDEVGHLAQALNTMAKELKASHRRMRHLANYDSLTGLPNRHLFLDRLRHALQTAARSGHQLGLLFLDLDGFKSINDSLGHAQGDEVLKLVAARLRETVRASDTVARLGGDELTVIAEGIHGPADASALAEKLLNALELPYRYQDRQLQLSASIGITLYPRDGDTPDALLHNADTAMYEAKRRGKKGYCLFGPELDQAPESRVGIKQQLAQAIDAQALELHFQPQIHVQTGRILGIEALLRWPSPQADIQPGDLIPLMEDAGLITRATRWILSEGCRHLRDLRALGLPELRLAINLSGKQLAQTDLTTSIRSALEENGLPAQALEIEITENSLLDAERGQAGAERLRLLGVRLAIDNFGTGYSSLVHLHRLGVASLKVDRSLIVDIASNQDNAFVTSAILSLARQLGVSTLAQGVETPEQWAILRAQGCDLAQGYLFCRPLPPTELMEWVRAHQLRSTEWPAQLLTDPRSLAAKAE
jgi:diguanylate cyclase (GGDEF)-like protein